MIGSLMEQRFEFRESIIKCYAEHLKKLNELLEQSKKEDREMIELVHKKEVLSEMEKQTFTDDFQSQVTKDIIAEIEKIEQELLYKRGCKV